MALYTLYEDSLANTQGLFNSVNKPTSTDGVLVKCEQTTSDGVLAVACRGFAVGVALQVGQKLLSGISSGRLAKSPIPYLKGLINTDTLRFASFIALSGSTYKLIITLLKKKCKEPRGWHAVVAGLAAGLISAIDDPSRRHTLSLYISARALGALVTTLHRHGYLPSIPHFVILMYAVCHSFIVSRLQSPEYLPRSYYHTLLKWIRVSEEQIELYYRQPSDQFIHCNVLMHDGSCHMNALRLLCSGLLSALKIYLPIYCVPLLLFKSKMLLTKPLETLGNLAKNTLFSALYLDVDITTTFYTLCLLRNIWGGPPPAPAAVCVIAGLVGGAVGLPFERRSRRIELLYYAMAQVFYGIWKLLSIKKPLGLHRIPYGSVWMFALSLMVIMHAFEREKESISPFVDKGLQFLLN